MLGACRGDMRCVNQNGGYLCIPQSLYSQPYARAESPSYTDPLYPDTSLGFPEQFPPPPISPAVGSGPGPGPSYPIVGRSSAPCLLGYTLGEDGSCVGKSAFLLSFESLSGSFHRFLRPGFAQQSLLRLSIVFLHRKFFLHDHSIDLTHNVICYLAQSKFSSYIAQLPARVMNEKALVSCNGQIIFYLSG